MMINMTTNDVKIFILHKLYKLGCWGAKHTSFENLKKGLPGHVRGDVKQVAKGLIKEGLLLSKPTSYGLEVSLNPRATEQIKKLIQDYLSERL